METPPQLWAANYLTEMPCRTGLGGSRLQVLHRLQLQHGFAGGNYLFQAEDITAAAVSAVLSGAIVNNTIHTHTNQNTNISQALAILPSFFQTTVDQFFKQLSSFQTTVVLSNKVRNPKKGLNQGRLAKATPKRPFKQG